SGAAESMRDVTDVAARRAQTDRELLFDLIRPTLRKNQADRKEQRAGQAEETNASYAGVHRGLLWNFCLARMPDYTSIVSEPYPESMGVTRRVS
ncbi:MAG TPA: hypothetical protein VJA94_12150, partial [Candidatus Angelobacter sp.]